MSLTVENRKFQPVPTLATSSRSALQYGTPVYNKFIQDAEKVSQSLTANEVKALFEYTGWFYAGYQEFLNRPANSPVKLSDASFVVGVESLDSATAKTVNTVNRTLYRGAMSTVDHNVGDTVTFTSFISTTVNPQVAVDIISSKENGVIYEFHTHEGIELNDSTSEQGLREKEVLLGRGKTFTVTSVQHGVEFRNGSKISSHTVVTFA